MTQITLPMTVLPAKMPGESVTVKFDFSSETSAITSPVCTVLLEKPVRADSNPAAMVLGSSQIDGTNPAQALQRFTGGLQDNDYVLLCTATAANGDTLICPARLSVRNPSA